jgi:hypothetical protein
MMISRRTDRSAAPEGAAVVALVVLEGVLSSDDLFGSSLYYISFLGKPSTTRPWMLQFGGHHLALHITIAGSTGVLTPTLPGAQPASFKQDGKTIRPLGRKSDTALALRGASHQP